MDVFVAGCCGMGISSEPTPGQMRWVPAANRVLFGSEERLVDSGQALGTAGSEAIDLGDLDGDGDLDAFVGNTQGSGEVLQNNLPNEVWLNDGSGQFSDSGQMLGQQRTYAVALGDVDGDGDLDALVGNDGADELWLNDGDGRFTLSAQRWSQRITLTAALVDMDGDGDLDALTGHELTSSFAWWRQGIIWWNDGRGHFTEHMASYLDAEKLIMHQSGKAEIIEIRREVHLRLCIREGTEPFIAIFNMKQESLLAIYLTSRANNNIGG